MEIARLIKGVADETRLRIVRLLQNGPYHVNEILFVIGGKQSNLSHHLRILQDAGIVRKRREGSLIFYTLVAIGLQSGLLEWLKANCDEIPHETDDRNRKLMIDERRRSKAEQFFNSIGEQINTLQDRLFNSIYTTEELLEKLDGRFRAVLDIGCGSGRNLPLLATVAENLYAVDSSPRMVQLSEHICLKKAMTCSIKLGDMSRIPFDDEMFDLLFCNMVLHHVSDPAQGLNECARVLASGGRLLLVELLSHQDETMRDQYADLWLGFGHNELHAWLQRAGFTLELDEIKTSSLDNNRSLEVAVILAVKK
jgi:ubiquinone/menaquinone biosynthesis C-methylase UbiE/DNA-binding HxlR family transcriptional regulator